jgi:hypothetical protein
MDADVDTKRGVCVCRLTSASIFTRCLRISSSFSLTENASDMNASAEGGSNDRWGLQSSLRTVASLGASKI